MQKSVCGHNSVCLCMFVCVRKKNIYIYISVYVTSKQVCLVVLVLTYVILVGGASSLWASDLGKATMGRAFRFGFRRLILSGLSRFHGSTRTQERLLRHRGSDLRCQLCRNTAFILRAAPPGSCLLPSDMQRYRKCLVSDLLCSA